MDMEQTLQSRSSNTVEDEETECETKEKKFWFFKPNSCGPLHYPQGENLIIYILDEEKLEFDAPYSA